MIKRFCDSCKKEDKSGGLRIKVKIDYYGYDLDYEFDNKKCLEKGFKLFLKDIKECEKEDGFKDSE